MGRSFTGSPVFAVVLSLFSLFSVQTSCAAGLLESSGLLPDFEVPFLQPGKGSGNILLLDRSFPSDGVLSVHIPVGQNSADSLIYSATTAVATAVANIFTVPSWFIRSTSEKAFVKSPELPFPFTHDLTVNLQSVCDDDCQKTNVVQRAVLTFEQLEGVEESIIDADFLVLWIDSEGNYHVGSVPNPMNSDLLDFQHGLIADSDDELRSLLEDAARKYPDSAYIIYLNGDGKWRIRLLMNCESSHLPECSIDATVDQQYAQSVSPEGSSSDSKDYQSNTNDEESTNQQASESKENRDNKAENTGQDDDSAYSSGSSSGSGSTSSSNSETTASIVVRSPLSDRSNLKRRREVPEREGHDSPSREKLRRVDKDDGQVLFLDNDQYQAYVESERSKYAKQYEQEQSRREHEKKLQEFRRANNGKLLEDFDERSQAEELKKLDTVDYLRLQRHKNDHETSEARVIWVGNEHKSLCVVNPQQYARHLSNKRWLERCRHTERMPRQKSLGADVSSVTSAFELTVDIKPQQLVNRRAEFILNSQTIV